MDKTNVTEGDRVRANTCPDTLRKIDKTIEENIRYYSMQSKESVARRIEQLEQEWDIERLIETHASSVALLSLALGITRGKKWLFVAGGVLGFLFVHAMKGSYPPSMAFRRFGVRTRSEIDREKFALKILRGDFKSVQPLPDPSKFASVNQVIEAVKSPA